MTRARGGRRRGPLKHRPVRHIAAGRAAHAGFRDRPPHLPPTCADREIWIEPGEPVPDRRVGTSPRIGCQTAPAPWDMMPWRFFVAGNPHVTPGTPRHASSRTRARGPVWRRARHRA